MAVNAPAGSERSSTRLQNSLSANRGGHGSAAGLEETAANQSATPAAAVTTIVRVRARFIMSERVFADQTIPRGLSRSPDDARSQPSSLTPFRADWNGTRCSTLPRRLQ